VDFFNEIWGIGRIWTIVDYDKIFEVIRNMWIPVGR